MTSREILRTEGGTDSIIRAEIAIARLEERVGALETELAKGSQERQFALIEVARLGEQVKAATAVMDERQNQVKIAFEGAATATSKAENAQKIVNESQNEFRQTLKDQAGSFATLPEMSVVREQLARTATRVEVELLKDALVKMATAAEVERAVDRISAVEKQMAGGVGKAMGVSQFQAILFALVPIIIAAIALYLAFKK